jgi:PAP2 superfamily
MTRSWLARSHSGVLEVAGLAALYALYELVRGFGGVDLQGAKLHTADIVSLERSLHIFGEQALQHWAEGVGGLPAVLGILYLLLHFAGTGAALVWLHRNRQAHFAVVRTTLVAATALALVGYLLFPAAPPRLAGLGFADTVSAHTGLNLSSDALGSLYNPVAAVPSLHFGYSLIVGFTIAALAHRRSVRIAGALYPVLMLIVIVATGNHFFFDAAAGGIVVIAAWLVARALVRTAAEPAAHVQRSARAAAPA